MEDSTENHPPLIIGFKLARLRDRSLRQAEEIQHLLEIMKAAEQVMKMTSDSLFALLQGKKDISPQYRKQLVGESMNTLFDGLEGFVDTKSARILKVVNYLQLIKQDVKENEKELKDFEKEWDDIKRQISVFKNEFLNRPPYTSVKEAMNDIDYIKMDVLHKAMPLIEKLIQLENKLQMRVINMIAFIANTSSTINTNELYRLFTAEP
jgi:hypothetical protein